MAPRRRKSAEDRKAEIVQVAIQLAADVGPDKVTTQRIATVLEISQPAIFRHFATKADIWLAVGQMITLKMSQDEIDTGVSPAIPRLIQVVTTQCDFIARNPAIPAILFSRELHVENEPLRAHFAELMARRVAGFRSLIARGIEAGELKPDIDALAAAKLVLAAIQGLAMRWSLENRRFDLKAEGAAQITLLINGFRI